MKREIKVNLLEKIIGIAILAIGGSILYFTLQTEGLHPAGYGIILLISFLLLFLGALSLIVKAK